MGMMMTLITRRLLDDRKDIMENAINGLKKYEKSGVGMDPQR